MADASFQAFLMDAQTGGQNRYEFTAVPSLLDEPADDAVEALFAYLNAHHYTDHPVRYELNSVMKSGTHRVITGIGSMRLPHGDIPFMVMISEKR